MFHFDDVLELTDAKVYNRYVFIMIFGEISLFGDFSFFVLIFLEGHAVLTWGKTDVISCFESYSKTYRLYIILG